MTVRDAETGELRKMAIEPRIDGTNEGAAWMLVLLRASGLSVKEAIEQFGIADEERKAAVIRLHYRMLKRYGFLLARKWVRKPAEGEGEK